tara:strand:- start:78 stop:323 length:246 start_codon:yes stop_codon:yes gene_type:complete
MNTSFNKLGYIQSHLYRKEQGLDSQIISNNCVHENAECEKYLFPFKQLDVSVVKQYGKNYIYYSPTKSAKTKYKKSTNKII